MYYKHVRISSFIKSLVYAQYFDRTIELATTQQLIHLVGTIWIELVSD